MAIRLMTRIRSQTGRQTESDSGEGVCGRSSLLSSFCFPSIVSPGFLTLAHPDSLFCLVQKSGTAGAIGRDINRSALIFRSLTLTNRRRIVQSLQLHEIPSVPPPVCCHSTNDNPSKTESRSTPSCISLHKKMLCQQGPGVFSTLQGLSGII